MRYEFHPEALEEYDEAGYYYARQRKPSKFPMPFITPSLCGFGWDANQLRGPNGHELEVVSIWMIEDAGQQTKFITLHPARR